jgi:DNA-binding response OmpR family regulator
VKRASPRAKVANVIAAKKAGVNNYIVKPFNVQTLKAKIEGVLPRKPWGLYRTHPHSIVSIWQTLSIVELR